MSDQGAKALSAQEMYGARWNQGILPDIYDDAVKTPDELRADVLEGERKEHEQITAKVTIGALEESSLRGTDRFKDAQFLHSNAKEKKKDSLGDIMLRLNSLQSQIRDAIKNHNRYADAIEQALADMKLGKTIQGPDGKYLNEEIENAIKEYERITGKEFDRDDPDVLEQLGEWHRQYTAVLEQKDLDIENDLEVGKISAEEGVAAYETLFQQGWQSNSSQIEIEKKSVLPDTQLELRDDLDNSLVEISDVEIEQFMKDFARLQKLEDPIERMRQEKMLIDSASEAARELLSMEEDTEHLFDEDYFKLLEGQLDAQPETNLQSNPATTLNVGNS